MPNRDRILLIEDDADSLTASFVLLVREGYSVLTAESGAQAIDLLERGLTPRLIVLDLMMPRVSGWDVLKYLGGDPALRRIPVIVLTALAAEEAGTVGADIVLTKPVEPQRLLFEVAKLYGPAV